MYFEEEQRNFLSITGVAFSFEILTCDDAIIARAAANLGKKIFSRICAMSPL
jgi:hypothetical protein